MSLGAVIDDEGLGAGRAHTDAKAGESYRPPGRSTTCRWEFDSETATCQHAEQVAKAVRKPCVITLEGPLGSGKTTWVRALLRALGHAGMVPSPTYTLVEPYSTARGMVYHVDLYRLQSEEELEELGVRELLGDTVVLLVEWPERWPELRAQADLRLELRMGADEQARQVSIVAATARGQELLRSTQGGDQY